MPSKFAGRILASALALTSLSALAAEWSAGVGALLQTTNHGVGRFGDVFIVPEARGRGSLGPVLLDGQLQVSMPTSTEALFSGTATARIGVDMDTWNVAVGPSVQWNPAAPSASALQFLPSLRAEARFGRWGLALGLFDEHAQIPVHLSFLFDQHELGFIAPLGAQARTSFAVGDSLRIGLHAMGFQLFQSSVYRLTISGIFGSELKGGEQ